MSGLLADDRIDDIFGAETRERNVDKIAFVCGG